MLGFHAYVSPGRAGTGFQRCGAISGGIAMADLLAEYTDVRGRTHTVEHIVVPDEDKTAKEQIMEELLFALARTGR